MKIVTQCNFCGEILPWRVLVRVCEFYLTAKGKNFFFFFFYLYILKSYGFLSSIHINIQSSATVFDLQILALQNSLVELVIEGIIHEGVFLANHCDPSNLVINR